MSNSVNLSLDVTKTGIQNPLIKVRQGDGGFETLHTTVTSNGEPLDLQGWTITFMGTTAGNHKIVDANVSIIEAPNGIFDYTPSKAWGMDIGEFKIAYFKFVKGDGSASSANFRVNVIEAVDLTQEEAQNYISVVDATIAEVKEHLESSLASVSASVAATSSAVGSLSVSVSSTASSAVSQINSATSNASSVATSAVNNVSSVASSAVDNINGAADVYVKKSGSETIDGDKTFVRPINGALATRTPAFTDFNDVAKNMVKYAGSWVIGTQSIANSPLQSYYTVTVTPAFGDGGSGYIELVPFVNGSASKYIAVVGSNTLSAWKSFAFDDSVVHKTGNETIAGDKTFTGNVNFGGDTNWIVVSISTNGTGEIKYRRKLGLIEIYAWYTPNSDGTGTITPLTLPVGFRPYSDIRDFGMNGSNFNAGSARISISANGVVEIGAEPKFYSNTAVRLHTIFSAV